MSHHEGEHQEQEQTEEQPQGLQSTDEQLTEQDMDRESGEQLPDREAMSLVNANIAIPVNAAVAANVLSDDAIAYANAEQDAAVDQSS